MIKDGFVRITAKSLFTSLLALFAGSLIVSCIPGPTSETGCTEYVSANAAEVAGNTITWMGHTWTITTDGMAGNNLGSVDNVVVDGNGDLHLKITQVNGKWICAELHTNGNLGFGTYQWQVNGAIDKLDKNVVLGFYPYGPFADIGVDGQNEIDIEYSLWGQTNANNGDWTVYPATGPIPANNEKTYKFSLGGSTSTSRFIWSTSKIDYALMNGYQSVGSTANQVNSWTYSPNNSTVNIPQKALPLAMNLWLYNTKPPSDGKPVDIVIHSFTYTAPGGNPTSLVTTPTPKPKPTPTGCK